MFAADMIVSKEAGFFDPILNDFLHPRAKGNFPKGHGRSPTWQIPLDFQADLFSRESHLFQDHQGYSVGLTEYGQDKVLGPEVVVLVTLCLFPSEDDDLPALIRKSFEHPASF
jgi:hypothetical protein